ncbi:Integrase catalytic domain-containing protein [Citrus sinensis]|nr:Integrase catalytic domain-containing protein [Citrus sinensis]
MREGVSIQDHIDTFNKIILDLEGVENVKISDEDKAFFLLSSLPKPYEGFVDTMLYGRTSLTLEDAKASLCSKEIQRNENDESNGEGLVARKEKKKDQKEKKKKESQERSRDAAVASDDSTDKGYQSADLLIASKGDLEDNGGIRVTKGGTIVMRGEKKNGLYMLIGSSAPANAVMTVESDVDKTNLWHLRLAHMSMKRLQELKKQGLLCGDKMGSLDFCENCVFGKAHRAKFPKGMHRSEHVLDYVHTDLWGPAQVVEKFKVWKTLVENQSGRKLKALRTDNGLEFCNREFETFCQKHGILRHQIVRFTPQQNGLAERMNRTIVDKTRGMLINSKLPRCFWAEAVSTTCYLVNRSPSAAIDFKTPKEIWFGRLPKFENLRIFGCPAYVHINQGELNAKALKGFFVGYPDGVKGYRVWCGEQRKCIISKDVVFHEVALLKDNAASNADILANNDSEQSAESPKLKVEFSGHERLASDSEDMVHTEDQDTESPTLQQTDLQDYQLARDRERRQTRAPDRLSYADLIAFALVSADEIAIEEPESYFEAISGKDCDKWLAAMQEEMDSLQRNKTWTLVPNPGNRKLISCKWIFKKNEGIPEVEPFGYKARLVARGIILARVALLDMELEQIDVKTAFLHGNLEEHLLMKQPEGFEHKGKEDHVYLLHKSLYGLKQSSRQWYRRFDEFMLNNGYHRSKFDNCVYYSGLDQGGAIYLLLYVDDMLIASKHKSEVEKLKNLLKGEFEMKDLRSAKMILGMEIFRNRAAGTLFLSQEKYIKKVLERGSSTCGLLYGNSRSGVSEIVGYVDSDFAGDLDKRKSILGYMFMLNMCILIKNPVFHERTKHIDVKLQFSREEAAKGTISMSKIHIDMNPADALTKVLPTIKFEFCVNLMGVLPNSN